MKCRAQTAGQMNAVKMDVVPEPSVRAHEFDRQRDAAGSPSRHYPS